MANGEASGRQLGEKQLRRMGVGQLARSRCALPPEEGAAVALLSGGKYHFPKRDGSVQPPVAGAMVAADLIRTAKFGLAAAFANLDTFVEACPLPAGLVSRMTVS